jgi:hypothetical protein
MNMRYALPAASARTEAHGKCGDGADDDNTVNNRFETLIAEHFEHGEWR